jgi:hypothetical protein
MHNEWTVLSLVIGPEDPRPWSIEEVERAIGDRIVVADSLARLHAEGLVHRTADGFVFPTRAAAHFHAISE